MKEFRKDLEFIFLKLKNHEYFAFSKYADGEFGILEGVKIGNNDFKYKPDDEEFFKKLWDSFTYDHPNYYIGIGCHCCMGYAHFEKMRTSCKRPDDHITWANIFVNANYPFYVDNFIPEYSNHKVILVCNDSSNVNALPFRCEKVFRCQNTAWENGGYDLIDEVKEYIASLNIKNHLFLFCAGPFGNILSHQLHVYSKENIYLDIGSTLDLYLHGRPTRRYLKGEGHSNTASKICTWSENGKCLA